MSGRNPHEEHRAATPLELLFDLTFVIGFGIAGEQLAHFVAEGHYATGIGGFLIAMFSICWAWVNYSWYSSAYDTDDWGFRLATMVQMVGVIVLSLGIPDMFRSLDEGSRFGGGIMVLGYIVMRIAMVFLWFRAARQDSAHRTSSLIYGFMVLAAQLVWTGLVVTDPPLPVALVIVAAFILLELAAPVIAESWGPTPWHAHHIAERHGLLAIIALGEGVIGTVASVSAVVEAQGWSFDAVMIAAAGIGLTFGMWWIYFLIEWGDVLEANREKAFLWGYGHLPVFASIAAVGAGLHVAAYHIEHKAHIGEVATMLSMAIPVALFMALVYGLYRVMCSRLDALHVVQLLIAAIAISASVAMAAFGFSITACLAVLTLAPAISIVTYEVLANRLYGET